MPEFPSDIQDVLDRVDASAAIDMLIITLSIYWLLLLIRGTTAMTVLRGVIVLLIAAVALSRALDLRVVSWMLRSSVTGLVIGVAIVFQPEIRRALERLGRTGLRSMLGRAEQRHSVDSVVRAAVQLARLRRGALIVLERETGLQDVIDTGVPLLADVSGELLVTIFTPGAPLHDGAVVIHLDRAVAAGCTLSESPLPADFGMRHRAALGITENTDAVVVVVSEERGQIALASSGRMLTDMDEARLSTQLHRLFGLDPEEQAASPPPRRTTDAPAAAERRAS